MQKLKGSVTHPYEYIFYVAFLHCVYPVPTQIIDTQNLWNKIRRKKRWLNEIFLEKNKHLEHREIEFWLHQESGTNVSKFNKKDIFKRVRHSTCENNI